MIADVVKATVLVTLAAVVQVSFVNSFELIEGHADVLLLTLVGVGLLRGPLFGACAGFWAGLLVDTMTLETLGLTSLLLTLAGYLAGRLGELDVGSREPARPHPHHRHAAHDRRRGGLAARPPLPRRFGVGGHDHRPRPAAHAGAQSPSGHPVVRDVPPALPAAGAPRARRA